MQPRGRPCSPLYHQLQVTLARIPHTLPLFKHFTSIIYNLSLASVMGSECELARPINTVRNVFGLKVLWHLDIFPLIVGISVAVVVVILLFVAGPAILGVLGFGALGPVAGKSSLLVDPPMT